MEEFFAEETLRPQPHLALSFLQPWLWAILEKHKGVSTLASFCAIENRTWRPVGTVFGMRIALHASKGWDQEGADFIGEQLGRSVMCEFAGSPRGAIVGTAIVAGAVRKGGHIAVGRLGNHQARLVAESPWAFGPWCWVLEDVRKLREPVPCRGRLGLWPMSDEIAARVRELEVTTR